MLFRLVGLLSSAFAFINMNEVDMHNLDVRTFDFKVVYELDLLAMKYSIVNSVATPFLEDVVKMNME